MSEFYFRSVSLESIDIIYLNSVYALILTRSMLGLLPVTFRFAAELWPLIEVDWTFMHTWPLQHEKH